MPENNQLLSVESQLVGLPLAGPESFSQAQLDYLKRALGVDETVLWSGSQELTLNTEITLSETYKNFEYICFECSRLSLKKRTTYNTYDDGSHYTVTLNDSQIDSSGTLLLDVTTLSLSNVLKPKVIGMGRKQLMASSLATSTAQPLTLIAVYGIHRIAGGN